MRAKETVMATELLKMSYVQSRVNGNALAQLEPRLREDTAQSYKTANWLFNTMTAAFGYPNCKQTVRMKHRALRQGDRDFSSFWAEFHQRIAPDTLYDDEAMRAALMDGISNELKLLVVQDDVSPTLTKLISLLQKLNTRL